MATEWTPAQLRFHAFGRRDVIGRFDGGRITLDGGGVLLREADLRLGLPALLVGRSDLAGRHSHRPPFGFTHPRSTTAGDSKMARYAKSVTDAG